MALVKIISGGQTEVDRAALDAALAVGFSCGGWCPADRKAEDGPIPDKYPMSLLSGGGYRQRTIKNVQDSDGTAILFNQTLSGGMKLTRGYVHSRKEAVHRAGCDADYGGASGQGDCAVH
jgi:hypothetical protein